MFSALAVLTTYWVAVDAVDASVVDGTAGAEEDTGENFGENVGNIE